MNQEIKPKKTGEGKIYILIAIVLVVFVWFLPYVTDIVNGRSVPFFDSLKNIRIWPFNNTDKKNNNNNNNDNTKITYKTLDCKLESNDFGVKSTSEVTAYYIDETTLNAKSLVKYTLEPSVATDTQGFVGFKTLTHAMISPLKDFSGFTYVYNLEATPATMQLTIDYTKINEEQLKAYNESSIRFDYKFYRGTKADLKASLETQKYICQ